MEDVSFSRKRPASRKGEVLVAILKDRRDFQLLRDELWYRVPVQTCPKRWPPEWLAFYQPKVFGKEGMSIRYFGRVRAIRQVRRRDLFPHEIIDTKSDNEYFQIFLEKLETRSHPIVSTIPRRIVFVPTTWQKLAAAENINDLFDDSPLEDALWAELKRLGLPVERQVDVTSGGVRYKLDFELHCVDGKINIEADGDIWHADPARIPEDNKRNNALTSQGWQVLRFNGTQIRESFANYCIPQIMDTVNSLGGTVEATGAPRHFHTTDDGIVQQLGLFSSEDTSRTKSARSKKPSEK
jgi:very-short-patch-repair endonuclease